MSSYCVIGSGISGATIANLLSKKNSVHIYDKARGPGGRSSFKRLNKSKGFDHGAQYISPKSIQFKKVFLQVSFQQDYALWICARQETPGPLFEQIVRPLHRIFQVSPLYIE